jgi:hypothetical protein|tara:strand:- start:274 stop:411 length:138 start_codon:yes stop_codon:yes gene_type:complete
MAKKKTKRKNTCWKTGGPYGLGYERVPGTKPGAKGSCRPKKRNRK